MIDEAEGLMMTDYLLHHIMICDIVVVDENYRPEPNSRPEIAMRLIRERPRTVRSFELAWWADDAARKVSQQPDFSLMALLAWLQFKGYVDFVRVGLIHCGSPRLFSYSMTMPIPMFRSSSSADPKP